MQHQHSVDDGQNKTLDVRAVYPNDHPCQNHRYSGAVWTELYTVYQIFTVFSDILSIIHIVPNFNCSNHKCQIYFITAVNWWTADCKFLNCCSTVPNLFYLTQYFLTVNLCCYCYVSVPIPLVVTLRWTALRVLLPIDQLSTYCQPPSNVLIEMLTCNRAYIQLS